MFLIFTGAKAQNDSLNNLKKNLQQGIIIGNIMDAESSKPIPSTTITLTNHIDSLFSITTISEKDGAFVFDQLPYAYYSIKISAIGYGSLKMDSIYIRAERFDFDLGDLKLNKKTTPEELRAHLSSRFVKWQLPDRFEFLDAIPRTSTGKFWKMKLRERFGAA